MLSSIAPPVQPRDSASLRSMSAWSNRMMLLMRVVVLSASITAFSGCASQAERAAGSGETVLSDATRAAALATEAGGYLRSDPLRAHRLLLEALEADAYCGTAHNNLGVLYLSGALPEGVNLFAAAESFQLAAKLMPGRPDPRMNLGLVMERAGRLDDALAAHLSAVEAAPSSMASIEALTSLEIRLGKTAPETRERLKAIALGGSSDRWREWARDRLLRSER